MLHDEPKRISESSFAAVVRDFMSPANPKWARYSDASRELWGRELNRAMRPDCLGAVSVNTIRPSLVQAYLDGISDRPAKQTASLAALRLVERWAIVRDMLGRPITTGVEVEDSDGGHVPWTAEHVRMAEVFSRWDIARVVTLGANTGQRGSDLVRMGWSDIETYKGERGINVKQCKTGREVWIPITEELAAAMAQWEKLPGPFLRKVNGGLWTREQLTAAWTRHRDANADLAGLKQTGLVIHGLRGHACVRLIRSGATTRQVSDWVGMSEPMVKNYTKLSDQKDNALAAVHLLRQNSISYGVNKLREKQA